MASISYTEFLTICLLVWLSGPRMQNGTTQWSTGEETKNNDVPLIIPANGALSQEKTTQKTRSKTQSIFSRRDITDRMSMSRVASAY